MSDSSAAKIVVFTDLDDTLIQTKGKLPQHAHTSLGATDREGTPLSFFTQSQQMMLALFAQSNAIIIPVTGRNTAALNRVSYNFDSFRAVSHGAVVLKDKNRICERWLSTLEPYLCDWPDLLESCNREVNHIIESHKLDARSRVIIDNDIPAYISIKGKGEALEAIKKHNTFEEKFRRHENGRNHALLPPYASKKMAVEYIKKQLDLDINDLILGLGDSVSDLEFMSCCQFSMLPTNSQIARDLIHV